VGSSSGTGHNRNGRWASLSSVYREKVG